MKPAQFDYVRAGSVEQATALLAQHGARARILAGGQSLMAMLNIRLAEPALLIDISGLGGLRELRIDGDWVEIGAGVTQAELLAWPALATELPLLAMALPSVGHFQTRNRGTVCGSLAHSDPSSELPLCLALLGGEVVLRSQRGTRRLRGQAFQTGMLSTAREVDELLMDHPAVAQVVCFGMPHPKLGEEVAAVVVLREGQAATERELQAFVAGRAADYKVPKKILFMDEIPKGATGKLQRIGLAQKLGLG